VRYQSLPFLLLLTLLVLFHRLPPGSCAENPVPVSLFSSEARYDPDLYGHYLCSYYSRLLRFPEALATIRPLSENEFHAVSRSIEFIQWAGTLPCAGEEGRSLALLYRELHELLHRGRIKGDDDSQERSRGTRMTTHVPGDPSDPGDGDIYIHEKGLLENISLPLEGMESLSRSSLPGTLKDEKGERFRTLLEEGVIILSSYLVHECRHRKQKKYPGDPEQASEQEKKRYILGIEDQAYSDQYRYLSFLYRRVPGRTMRMRIRAFAESLALEVQSLFPGLREFNTLPDLRSSGE